MVGKIFYNTDTLVYKVVLFFLVITVLALCGNRSPERKLRLHIDTNLICGGKCGVGRTAGVETVMVYAIAFGNFKTFFPIVNITGSISGKRKNHSVVLSSEKRLTAVYEQFPVITRECDKAERGIEYIFTAT